VSFYRIIIMLFFAITAQAKTYVFVSFSLPENLFIETLKESSSLKLPVLLNGLYQNDLQKTAQKIIELIKEAPNLEMQINPNAFEKFNIKAVPAVVVARKNCFDVVYGNLTIKESLAKIKEKGECVK